LAEALASYDLALKIRPNFADVLSSRGNILKELNRFDDALASYDLALKVRPDYADALSDRGNTLKELKRFDEALASYDRALAVNPDHTYAFSGAADCVIQLCNWERRTRFAAEIDTHVSGKKSIIPPFVLLGYESSAALQLQCARNYIEHEIPSLPQPLWTGEKWCHDKLRVAYISADFRGHPVSHLLAGLFEQHDRGRFQTIAIALGLHDQSAMRARLKGAVEQFINVQGKSDRDVAHLIRELEVDIAVDLMGFTSGCRPAILAFRPAPIQVNYLGYAGTMGADHIDYIVADRLVIPEDQRQHYSEQVVYLPETYMSNDSKRRISVTSPSRTELNLPETGFVFCSFNNSYKITPRIFDVWMRLLREIAGSVLWLSGTNAAAVNNLRREAEIRGVRADRLIFAPRTKLNEDHLARQRLADLFLDTLPYNAHTAAYDALWAGLPVLTCIGNTFAGRVGASLLNSIGLPELVTNSLDEYETLALKLATDASYLQSIRHKLEKNRLSYPLFDTDRFRRHIEAAYTTMWEIWQRGESPRSFSVGPT
jgi:protein O-GlcNAc transferase